MHFNHGKFKKIPFENNTFDVVLCFRYFHHLQTNEAKARVIEELCRVSNSYVLISYLSPISITSIKRRARVFLGGRRSNQETTRLNEIENYFKRFDYELVKDFAQFPFFHTLHLAIFKRNIF